MLATCMSIRIKEKYKMVAVLSQISLRSPGTVARQAPASLGFPRQEEWSGSLLRRSVLLDSWQRYACRQGSLPFTISGTCSNSCPSSPCWHPTISSSFLPAFHLSQHQGLFQWVGSSHQMAQVFFSFSISPSSEYSVLISFRMDWFDLLAVQGTLKSLLLHHSLKASSFWHSACFMVQFSHPYMTTGKTITLTIWTFLTYCLGLW